MKLKLYQNKDAAILAGITPSNTGIIDIEVDPSALSVRQREMLIEQSNTNYTLTSIVTGSTEEIIAELDARAARADADDLERLAIAERYLESARTAKIDTIIKHEYGVAYSLYTVSYETAQNSATYAQQQEILSPLLAEIAAKNAAEKARYEPLVADAKAKFEAATLAAEKLEAEQKAQELAARIDARKKSGKFTTDIERGSRSEWGDPWIAKLTLKNGKKPEYDFSAGSYDGTTLTIPCMPGDHIAYGQKNYRKPKKTIHHVGHMTDEYKMVWD